MEFADLLRLSGISLSETALALHRPSDPVVRRILPTIAQNMPEVFDAYQGTHPIVPEATLKARKCLASFVPRTGGEFVFVGLFDASPGPSLLLTELDADPVFQRLQELTGGWTFASARRAEKYPSRIRFHLSPRKELAELAGRLVVADPGGRNFMRLAETTPLGIMEITREASLVPPMPKWDQLLLTRAELETLPREWALQLSQWRGVYLIVDQSDGARYVGSAYGVENLLGRWRNHVAGQNGVTKELSRRLTRHFRFSILELVSPTATADEVIAVERGWMNRLDTISHGLNT